MTAWVNLPRASPISRHIVPVCSEAVDSTYISDFDIKILASKPGKHSERMKKNAERNSFCEIFKYFFNHLIGSSMSRLESAIYPFPTSQSETVRCNNVAGLWTPCTCMLEMCIGWYPCGLKFCKGKIDNGIGNAASYRCGIKTCRKCYQFMYHVQQKQQCLWYD